MFQERAHFKFYFEIKQWIIHPNCGFLSCGSMDNIRFVYTENISSTQVKSFWSEIPT